MRPLLALLFALTSGLGLFATGTLAFEGGGYSVEIVVGYDTQPVVAAVRVVPPGARDWVSLPPEALRVERFDTEAQVLRLRCEAPGDPALASPVSLKVRKRKGVLRLGGRRIPGVFDWQM